MAKFFAIFLVLPAIIYAKIDVNIVASGKESERQVTISGENIDVISDQERNTFKLSDGNLKDAVRAYFGARPDDAYVKSPTPWGDLYQTYGWPQVTRQLRPRSGTILGVQSTPTIVLTQVFSNNSTKPAKFKAQISQEVQNTVSSSWEKGGELTVGQEISYGFDIKVVSVGGSTSFSYTSKWGESQTRSETVTVGSESGVEIELEPHQSVVAELYATRGTMKVKVDYDATLDGVTAVNYADTYKGHHFWALDINGVMSTGGLPTTASSSETINIGYYSDSRVVIKDLSNNKLLYAIPVGIH